MVLYIDMSIHGYPYLFLIDVYYQMTGFIYVSPYSVHPWWGFRKGDFTGGFLGCFFDHFCTCLSFLISQIRGDGVYMVRCLVR